MNKLRDREKRRMLREWRNVTLQAKTLLKIYAMRAREKCFKILKLNWHSTMRFKRIKKSLRLKKKRRILNKMRDLLGLRKRLKQGLKVLKISRRIKAKDHYFSKWHSTFLINRTARMYQARQMGNMKRAMFSSLSSYLRQIRLVRCLVKEKNEKKVKIRYLLDWVVKARHHSRIRSIELKFINNETE